MKEKTPLSHKVVRFQMIDFETSNSKSRGLKIKFVENYFFRKNYITSEAAVSHNVWYHQPLPPVLVTKKGFVIIIILSNYQ